MGHPISTGTTAVEKEPMHIEAGFIGTESGRESEKQQLLKLISYCQTGQGKSALLLGAEGIGKSTLVESFTVSAFSTTQTPSIILPMTVPTTPRQVSEQLLTCLFKLAQDNAYTHLSQIQILLSKLGLSWSENQVLELYKPFFEDPSLQSRPDAFEEGLTLYLSNSLSFFKKLSPNSEQLIRQVVTQLNQPWLLIYAGLELQLFSSTEDLHGYIHQCAVWNNPKTGSDEPIDSEESSEPIADAAPVESSSRIEFTGHSTSTLTPQDSVGSNTASEVIQLASLTAKVLLSISQILSIYKQAFILCIDQWDSIADLSLTVQSDLKQYLNTLLRYTTDASKFHGLILLACRSEQESYLISNDLYNRFRQKLLLGPLTQDVQHQILANTLVPYRMHLEDTVEEELYHLTRGNPALLNLIIPLLQSYAQAIKHNPKSVIDYRTYREHFAVNRAIEWVDLLLNQLHLAFVGSAIAIDPLLTKLVAHYSRQPFSVENLVALSDTRLSSHDISTILDHLKRFGFIEVYPEITDGKTPLRYWFRSAFILTILQERLCPVQADMPLTDKVRSLKRIIPLSIESGEMDYDKVLNILSMAATLDNPELAQYLEETMITAYHNTVSEPIKRSLLNGLAAFASENAIDTIRHSLHADSLALQEYACRQLLECLQTLPAPPGNMNSIIEEVCELAQHGPTPAHASVQQAAFALLIHYPQYGSVTRPRFEEGLNSPDTLIQLLSIHGLNQLGVQTLEFIEKTQTLLNNPNCDLTLAQAALHALEGFDYHHMMPILVDFLESHTDHPLWNEGLKLMLSIEPTQALPWVEQTLAHPETDTEIKLFLLRHLGSERSSDYENAIIRYLSKARHSKIQPELRWMAIRSLGWIGYSRPAYDILLTQQAQCMSDPILAQTLQFAIQQLAKRLSLDEEDSITVEAQPKAKASQHTTGPSSRAYRDPKEKALDDLFTGQDSFHTHTQTHASAANWS